MDTKQIAARLKELCEKNEFEKAQQELYADDVISIEQKETESFAKETKGKDAVFAKIKKFDDMVETMYSNRVSEPLIAGNSFSFISTMDVKMKEQERMTMSELCVYETKDGKVISERFFM